MSAGKTKLLSTRNMTVHDPFHQLQIISGKTL